MTSAPTPTWREWTALPLLALPLFMMATDYTVMFLAMPAVAADLAPSTTQMLWIMHIGEFVAAGTVITMGRLTDKIGRRRLLFLAMALYGVASTLAAFAPDPNTLLTARVLIGLATAAASPTAFSMARAMFGDARHFSIAFAILMGAFSAGGALGPPMGGLLLEYSWWGAVFLINAPVAALVLLAGWRLLPPGKTAGEARIDVISVALSMAAVMLTVYGLQEIADQGFAMLYLSATVAGGVLAVAFVRRQRRLAEPLLDLGLFRIATLRVAAAVLVLTTLGFVAVDFILVQYLQIVAGVSMTTLGVLLAVPGIATVIGTALTPPLHRRIAASHLMALSLLVSLAGTGGVIAAILWAPSSIVFFTAGSTLISLGMSPVMVLGAQLLITSAPRQHTGSAVAVQDIGAGLGGAVGMALIGSLSMLVYSRTLPGNAPDEMTAAGVADAAESTGGAMSIADELGGTTGHGLLTAVRDSWSLSTMAAYITALAIGVVTVIFVLRGLRGVRLPSDDHRDPAPIDESASPANR